MAGKIKLIRFLILEDDIKTLATLFRALSLLEDKFDGQIDFGVTVMSDYTQVADYINKMGGDPFDIVLLDRDCRLGGSFHVLDINKFGPDKIIGISSVPTYNQELGRLGVTKIVDKDYSDLEPFALKVTNLIEEMIERRANES